MTYGEIHGDYEYITEHNIPYDFCGAICNTEMFRNVLDKKVSIEEAMVRIIEATFEKGYEDRSDNWLNTDERALRIKEKYHIQYCR